MTPPSSWCALPCALSVLLLTAVHCLRQIVMNLYWPQSNALRPWHPHVIGLSLEVMLLWNSSVPHNVAVLNLSEPAKGMLLDNRELSWFCSAPCAVPA